MVSAREKLNLPLPFCHAVKLLRHAGRYQPIRFAVDIQHRRRDLLHDPERRSRAKRKPGAQVGHCVGVGQKDLRRDVAWQLQPLAHLIGQQGLQVGVGAVSNVKRHPFVGFIQAGVQQRCRRAHRNTVHANCAFGEAMPQPIHPLVHVVLFINTPGDRLTAAFPMRP